MADPPVPLDYLGPHPIRAQIWNDITAFSGDQVFPSLIMAIGAFIYAWSAGQVTSFGQGLKFVSLSVLAGLGIYLVIALIKAPVIVVGWHLRQISSLSLKLREIDSALLPPQTPTNSFTDFRVLAESKSYLRFEVWYQCDDKLGINEVSIEAWASENGKVIPGLYDYDNVNVIPTRAYLELSFKFNAPKEGHPEQGPESITSTGIMLTMQHTDKSVVFHRQEFQYPKVWQDEVLS